MKTVTTCSTKDSIEAAVGEIRKAFQTIDPKMVIYFASSIYEPSSLSQAMASAFPGAAVFGCSSSGEIVTGRMLKKSLVAMACSSETIADIAVGVVRDIKNGDAANGIAKVFAGFESHYGQPMDGLDYSQYVGIVLIDGLSVAEEKIMDLIGDKTNVFFIGGSAGDDLKFECTHVFANGEACADAAVLALLKPAAGYDIVKTQSFLATDKRLIATEVNEEMREVIAFNGKPAAQAYAEALGITIEEAPANFMSHPLGLVSDNDIFVRSPQQIRDGKLVFYCKVVEGMDLAILDSTNIVADTKAALSEKCNAGNGVAGIINFHCILRTLELEKDGLTDAYGKVFCDAPTVGFSTYGEEYLGHINQTSAILLLR
jgi:hypothetical protein